MNIEFLIITKSKELSENIFLKFLEKSINGVLKFNKYDYKEPLKKELDINKLIEVKQMFDYYGNALFKGKNKQSMSVNSYNEGINIWMGSLVINKNLSNSISDIISLIEFFSDKDQIIFGNICSEVEYNLKHKVLTQHSYSWKGVSRFDFFKFLPGIYWYTIFGKELVESIGKDKFKNLPNVTYTKPKDGCIAFHLNEPIDSEDLEARIAKEKELAKIIGQNYFYDKEGNIDSFSHPKQFLDFLKSLEK